MAHAGDGSAAIVDCWIEDETGERTDQITHGRPASVRMEIEWRPAAENPHFGFMVSDEGGRGVLAIASESTVRATGAFEAGETLTVNVAFDCLLANGSYSISPEVRHGTTERRLMDHRENAASFHVAGAPPSGGMVELPHAMSFSRSAAVERTGT